MQFNTTEQDKAEMAEAITKMKAISGNFYRQAINCGNHAFIEFCGLMNDYINMCEAALAQGIDFRECNTHSGIAMPMMDYQAKYLAEKLDCIYGPQLRKSPELREALDGHA